MYVSLYPVVASSAFILLLPMAILSCYCFLPYHQLLIAPKTPLRGAGCSEGAPAATDTTGAGAVIAGAVT
jgi:hypothetical protein